jgi:chromosome partitioning protein
MRIIAVANQKGGCGKTTTAISLSSSLALRGKKVLLVDCDPQAHATIGLNVSPSDLEKSIYHVLTPANNGALGIEDVVQYVKENFDLAPSSVILSALEQDLSGAQGRENRLHEAIRSLQVPYDFVVIDCPPSVGLLCINALRACDEVIIPIDMSLFSLRGVAKLVEIILLIKDKLGHEIRPRALITMYDFRTRYSKQVLQKVKETFGSNVFESSIRYNIRLRETVDHGLPIGDYDKHAIGYKDYEKLAEEVLRGLEVGDAAEQPVVEAARDILQNTEDYMDSVKEALEEGLNTADMSEGAAYQCAPSSEIPGEGYTSNGPGGLPEDER